MKKLGLLIMAVFSIFWMYQRYDKEKDALNKKIFLTNITEIKQGGINGKTVSDELEFKNNKVFSKFLNEKFSINWMSYTITKDSTYTDSITEAEVRYFEVHALFKDDDNQETKVFCKIENEIINGEVKMYKNDKIKKEFEFSGQEKATKLNDKKK